MIRRLCNRVNICICLLVISIMMFILTFTAVKTDVYSVRQAEETKALTNNTSVFAKQMDLLFSYRLKILDNLATTIAHSDLSNMRNLNVILQLPKSDFSEIALFDMMGNCLYGDAIELGNIQKEKFYETLVSKKSFIDPDLRSVLDGKKGIKFYSPVVVNQTTTMFLVGTYPEDLFQQYFDTASFLDKGSICIIDKKGDYFLGSKSYEYMLREKESNHLTHLQNGRMEKGESDVSTALDKNEQVTIHYTYGDTKYTACYYPMNRNEWYLVSTMPKDSKWKEFSVFSPTTLFLLIVLALSLILFLSSSVFLVFSYIQLKKERDRYAMIQSCDNAVAYELTFKPRKLEFYGDLKRLLGISHGPLMGEEVLDIYEWIHNDDNSIRGRFHQFFESNEDTFSTEVRIRNVRGDYSWHRIDGVLQRDEKNHNKRFVGRIVNVEEQMVEEKDLMQRAENDMLTGVLNKKTMEKRIALMLKNRGNKYVIFYMIDLDNFKNVNDCLGHIYGDQAISETAQCLNRVFADQDCIGRLGGDEFAVCVEYEAFDEQNLYDFIIQKAEKICEANRREYTDGASKVAISSSVGISIAPKMGESFEDLYTKADRALYISKENGKNQYHIYQPEDE